MKVLAKLIYGLGVALFAAGIVPMFLLFLFVGWVAGKLFDCRRCDVIDCPFCKHEDH